MRGYQMSASLDTWSQDFGTAVIKLLRLGFSVQY